MLSNLDEEEMVGDESPQVSSVCGLSNGFETLENVEEIQRSINLSVSRLEVAAGWLFRNRDAVSGPLLPLLRRRFDLTSLQAIEAAKLAHKLEYGGER